MLGIWTTSVIAEEHAQMVAANHDFAGLIEAGKMIGTLTLRVA